MGLDLIIKISLLKENQNITLGDRTFLTHAKIYWSEAITTMLCPYALKYLAEKLNVLKVDGDGITPMENFLGTTTDFSILKPPHIGI